jgi:hypothetical protein
MRRRVRLDHLARLTTPLGLHEHALLDEPRREHGYCVDDVARALVVTVRLPHDPASSALAEGYLDFLLAAQHDDGLMHNRRNPDGTWADDATADDHWGRALWAFGTAARLSTDPLQASRAREGAAIAMLATSGWPRALAYAALGVDQLSWAIAVDAPCGRVLAAARRHFTPPRTDRSWPWPYDRLSYANAVLPEAMMVTGYRLSDGALVADGLALLTWLVGEQTVGGHLSFVPAAGRVRADRHPAFDQQPIEAATLAEASRTAFELSGETRWLEVVEQCATWFEGDNDSGLAMCDAESGAGFDGLEPASVNLNRGAESTLAWLSTATLANLAGSGNHR